MDELCRRNLLSPMLLGKFVHAPLGPIAAEPQQTLIAPTRYIRAVSTEFATLNRAFGKFASCRKSLGHIAFGKNENELANSPGVRSDVLSLTLESAHGAKILMLCNTFSWVGTAALGR